MYDFSPSEIIKPKSKGRSKALPIQSCDTPALAQHNINDAFSISTKSPDNSLIGNIVFSNV